MSEHIMEIDVFIEMLKKLKEDKITHIYWTSNFDGSVSAPSKKHKNYRMSYGINKTIFPKEKEDTMLGKLTLGGKEHITNLCIVLLKDKDIAERLLEEPKEEAQQKTRSKTAKT